MRVQDVGLALLQDTLAEARAGRKVSWEQLASNLKERRLWFERDQRSDFANLLSKFGAGDEARTRNFQLGKLNFRSFIFTTYKIA